MSLPRVLRSLGAVSALCLILPASGQAAQRFASPTSTVTTGSCPESSPCRIDRAVAVAVAGDEVVVAPGDYAITYPVQSSQAIIVRGAAGQPRPRLIGAASLASPTLSLTGGATVSNLYVEANGYGGLNIQGGVAENLILYTSATSPEGAAISVKNTLTGVLVRNVIARSASPGGEAVSFKDGAIPGFATVVHVTAVAEGPTTDAFDGNVATGAVSIVNSIAVSGGGNDVSIRPGTRALTVRYSNYRPAISSGVTDAGGNQSAAPLFVDAAGRDYHQAAGSPTIDAATLTPFAGFADIDADPRLSLAPDMGADEFAGNAAPAVPGSPADENAQQAGQSGAPPSGPAASVPVGVTSLGAAADAFSGIPSSGQTIGVAPADGEVVVRRPGADTSVALRAGSIVPVGTMIDARKGEVAVTTVRDAGGTLQTARFRRGRFVVRQTPNGIARIRLTGGDFSTCPRVSAGARRATASSSRKRRSRRSVVRALWARDDGGRFSTHGRDAVATVRGTSWVTRDRCDGTAVSVSAGSVVVRPVRGGRAVVVRAGRTKLIRHKR